MSRSGFTRRSMKNGGWFGRLYVGGASSASKFAPLVIEPQDTAPTDFTAGSIYIDSTTGQLRVGNGSAYVPAAGDVVRTADAASAAGAIDRWAFIADRAYKLVGVKAIWTVIAGAAFTVDLKKCTGTQAPSAGTTMLTAAIDLNTTANTLATATLSATPANLLLAINDRIGLDFTGTPTNIAGLVVGYILRPV